MAISNVEEETHGTRASSSHSRRTQIAKHLRWTALVLVTSGCGAGASAHDAPSGDPSVVSPADGPTSSRNTSAGGAAEDAGPDAMEPAEVAYDGPDGGSASIGGTLANVDFRATAAYSMMRHPFTCRGFDGDYESQITITVSDERLCETMPTPADPCALVAGRRLLSFGVTVVRSSKTPLGSGAYAIGTAKADLPFATATLLVRDGACNLAIHSAISGTVTLSTVSDRFIAGDVELTFSNGGSLSGAFTAPACAGALAAAGPECEPLPTCTGTPICSGATTP
jgi:hypothetical protein